MLFFRSPKNNGLKLFQASPGPPPNKSDGSYVYVEFLMDQRSLTSGPRPKGSGARALEFESFKA